MQLLQLILKLKLFQTKPLVQNKPFHHFHVHDQPYAQGICPEMLSGIVITPPTA